MFTDGKQSRFFRVRVEPFQSTGWHLGHAWAGEFKHTRTESEAGWGTVREKSGKNTERITYHLNLDIC